MFKFCTTLNIHVFPSENKLTEKATSTDTVLISLTYFSDHCYKWNFFEFFNLERGKRQENHVSRCYSVDF